MTSSNCHVNTCNVLLTQNFCVAGCLLSFEVAVHLWTEVLAYNSDGH